MFERVAQKEVFQIFLYSQRAKAMEAHPRHMFLSDTVKLDSRGTQMPLEIDVTTVLDESVWAAAIC